MSSNQSNNQGTTRVDPAGKVYTTPAPGPAPDGTQIIINGSTPGTLRGGYAIPDKKGN
jgi:hypothetical protein